MLLTGDDDDSRYEESEEKFLKTDSPALDDLKKPPLAPDFITQVTTRNPPSYKVQDAHASKPLAPSWKEKVRSWFCCFAPTSTSYYKANDYHEVSPLRSSIPPFPPRVYREAVIPPKRPEDMHKKTLVLDLDETLVHSSFKPIPSPDYIIPVEMDGKVVDVYVLKRPWLDHFMEAVCSRFEVVVFTASLAKYADPLLDQMDKSRQVRWRLFREACCPHEGNYVKDLSCLGRDLSQTIIVDNSPHSYIFQPSNALPIGTFIDSMEDNELLEMLPVLSNIEHAADVRDFLGPNLQSSYSQMSMLRTSSQP